MRYTGTVFLALFLCTALVPSVTYAAEITFSPATLTKGVGEEFSVKVTLNPQGTGVNAADGTVTFDPAVLSVSSVNRDGSAFSLWTSEPAFSNSAGTVTFSGGTPTAFTNSGTIVTIKFKGKAAGVATVSVSKGSVLAADGKGSDVFKKGADATYTISKSAPPPPPPPAAEPEPDPEPADAGVSEGTPVLVPAPDVQSPTHKKPESWYATSTAVLNWKVPTSMASVRTGISQNKDDKPTKVATPAVQQVKYENLTEGVWYFTAQFKDDFEWGPIATREVRVDVTPPEEYDIALLESATAPPRFVLGTTDALSGMNRYEIYLQGVITATARAW